ncbi:LamG-like jellyroll fold domain-containing protein [Carboxylicivirga sp. M1479]|uniref:LamG-like jellyroll fold domain-containing protein n=1 Tax=Carboxylicivirga sp. M1479 TaxID=2594476 RepID=UPI001177C774|nr:LamG-like jellyroll fold domain-containing protein [Carboxylicivirga sp. M1479]TRX70345.1 PKD domain-containing protein [Carboxylicivirga sp. M1479]
MKTKNLQKWGIVLCLIATSFASFAQNVNQHHIKHQNSEWYKMLSSTNVNYFELTQSFDSYFKLHEYVKTDAVREYIRWTRNVSGNYDAKGNLLTIEPTQEDIELISHDQFRLKSSQNTGNWEQIGPFTFDLEARYRTNTQGVVRCIQQDPSNPNKILMGCIAGGVWLSTNSGDNWTNVSKDILVSTVSGICIAPSNTNIAYASAREGVIKSTDGGLTWDFTAFDDRLAYPNGDQPAATAVAHDDANKVIHASNAGLWVSADGGSTWSRKFNYQVYDVEFHPNNSQIAYAVVNENSWATFYRTTDGGGTWQAISNGYPTPVDGHKMNRTLIEVSAAAPNNVWVISGGEMDADKGVYGVFKSTDSGASFSNIYQAVPGVAGQPNFLARATNGEESGLGQLGWDFAFAVSDTDPDYMIAGTINVWKSTDGGNSWSYVNRQASGNTMYHMDFQCAEIYDTNTWIGTDGGIGLSTDGLQNLQDKSFGGFAAQQIWGMDRSWKSDLMNAGLYHGQIIMRDDNTYVGGWYNVLGADASSTYINYGDDRYMYGNSYGGRRVIRSEDRFTPAQSALMPVTAPKGYKQNEMLNHFYYGQNYTHTDNVFQRSVDKDALSEWNNLFTFNNKVSYIHPTYQNPDILFVIEQSHTLWLTTDGGENWIDRTPPPSLTLGYSLGNVCTDGYDANIVWCSLQGQQSDVKVLKSTDGGLTWGDYSGPQGNLPSYGVLSLAHQLGTDGGVYIGNSAGIWYRNNSMTEWINFSDGLPAATPVTHIRFKYSTGRITIGSLRSIFEGDVYEKSQPIAHPITAQRVNDLGEVKFVDHSVSASDATYSWSFPGGNPNISAEANPTVNYQEEGSYNVSLTVNDQFGSHTQMFQNFIEVKEVVELPLYAGYSFDGHARDITSNGWDATEDAISFVKDEDRRYVAEFNNSYSTISNHPGFEGASARTIAAWIKTNTANKAILGFGVKSKTQKWSFRLNDGGQLRVEVEGGYKYGTTLLNDGQWHHVACTFEDDGTPDVADVKLYVDGQEEQTGDLGASLINTGKGKVTIGDDPGNRSFIGRIDDLYMWDRALSEGEITDLYVGSLGFDEVLNDHLRLTAEGMLLNIENQGKDVQMKIFDVTGLCLHNFNMPGGTKVITFNRTGIYIVAIHTGNRIITKKILMSK